MAHSGVIYVGNSTMHRRLLRVATAFAPRCVYLDSMTNQWPTNTGRVLNQNLLVYQDIARPETRVSVLPQNNE